jgi:hypothetical protein
MMIAIKRDFEGEKFALRKEEIAVLMHELLFAYQKSMKKILGSGAAVFLHPTLDVINGIHKQTRKNLFAGKDIDAAFETLSKTFSNSGIVKEFRFEKIEPTKYVLHINGCIWAPHIHNCLKPKELICPFALITMAVFQNVTKNKVKTVDSEYLENGSRTEINAL